MGLTIHYTFSLKEEVALGVVRELARRTRDYARSIGCAQVGEPFRAEADDDAAPIFFPVGDPKDGRFGGATPLRGWLVDVLPGAGCESATFGLCQYRRRVLWRGRYVPTGFRGGWKFQSFCKTQYAGEPGWENFLQCHLQVVSILDFWRGLGVRVKVNDEGGYWETRSVAELRKQLGDYDRLVAAMGGAFKDGCDVADGGQSVESPIFSYKNFEQLEHEGQKEFGGRIEQLRKCLAKT